MSKHKKKSFIVIWLEFIPFLFLYCLVRMLPLKIAYIANKTLFRLLFILDRKHRKRSIQHVMHAKIKNNIKDARSLALASFDSFAKLLVEIIKSDQYYSPDKIGVRGCQATIDRAVTKGGDNCNVILVTAHYGNWEVAGTAWAEYTGIPMASIMRPFNNPLIGKIILKSRASKVHEMVNKQGGVKGILKALKKHKIATFLVDQHAASKDGGVETIFFGQPCRTHSAPALLHLKTGVPIMPELTRRVNDDFHFEFIVGELIEYIPTDNKEQDIKNVTQLYTTALEKLIAEQPEQWLWTHRRWLNINR
ncbi:MAG: lysophospholipid acyltransferase family protein [Victivallaceae bacterium]|nr:lysophospholipid acyltransferase family protein [Victivallaceae bacterium]